MTPDPPPEPSPPARRRWLRLSLRGLMVLVLILGGVAGWVAHQIRTQRQAIAAVRAVRGTIRFDYQGEVIGTNAQGLPLYRKEPAAPAWLRRWLGDELFQHVQSVDLLDPTTKPEILASVAWFDRLESLTIGARYVGDELGRLRGLNQLRVVVLSGPGTTDAMLVELGQIRSLTRVEIGRYLTAMPRKPAITTSPVTDAGLAHLGALLDLELIEVVACPQVTDGAMARLVEHWPKLIGMKLNCGLATVSQTLPALVRHHPGLQILGIAGSGATDANLSPLATLTQLHSLDISRTKITGTGLAHLRTLPALRTVMALTPDFNDAGLREVSGLANLTQLWLNTSQVTDAGLVSLVALPKLKELALSKTPITDAATATLAQITSLDRLLLTANPQLTDACLPALQKLPNLQTLEVDQTQITPAGIATLRQALPRLRRVSNQPTRPARPASSPVPRGVKP